MQYTTLGRTGVQVSRLCFGTMVFGAQADEKESEALFNHCLDSGINFFDTADVYSKGRSEEILGRLCRGQRDDLIIASKVHFPTGDGPNDRGLSRRHILSGVEASLGRLKTDRIDLYFAHGFDERTPIEETLRAFDDLVRQGKILYPAVSNWAAFQIATALGISARESLSRFYCIQPMYNLVKRQAEVELLPLAASEDLAVVTYSPLGGGLLTGKYADAGGRNEKRGRLDENEMYQKRYARPSDHETAVRFSAHAHERGVHPATLAVAWVLSHPHVTAPIIGARNVRQLEPSIAAMDVELTAEWREEISALSPRPPNATDRLEEQEGFIYPGTK